MEGLDDAGWGDDYEGVGEDFEVGWLRGVDESAVEGTRGLGGHDGYGGWFDGGDAYGVEV